MTKGSLGDVKNLRFTTVLNVRHARSDERVDRLRQKFAFYHSFERPTRTNRSDDERVVNSTGAIPAPRQKKNIFSDFFRRF